MAGGWAETLLVERGEALQAAAYFGALSLCGLLELRHARSRVATRRRARWPANILLTVTNFSLMLLLPVSVLAAAEFAAAHRWGLIAPADLTWGAAVALGFGARSLVAYAVHRATHQVPFLWRLHRVHHTDTQMDVSTTIRLHPLEFAFTIPLHVLGIVLLGIPPVAVMLYEVVDAAQTVATHGNLRLPPRLDKALRWLVVTPDMHRMHHSSHRPETDSNYGTTIALWDHLFGTYTMRPKDELADLQLGLAEFRDVRADSFLWLLLLPALELPPHGATVAGGVNASIR